MRKYILLIICALLFSFKNNQKEETICSIERIGDSITVSIVTFPKNIQIAKNGVSRFIYHYDFGNGIKQTKIIDAQITPSSVLTEQKISIRDSRFWSKGDFIVNTQLTIEGIDSTGHAVAIYNKEIPQLINLGFPKLDFAFDAQNPKKVYNLNEKIDFYYLIKSKDRVNTDNIIIEISTSGSGMYISGNCVLNEKKVCYTCTPNPGTYTINFSVIRYNNVLYEKSITFTVNNTSIAKPNTYPNNLQTSND